MHHFLARLRHPQDTHAQALNRLNRLFPSKRYRVKLQLRQRDLANVLMSHMNHLDPVRQNIAFDKSQEVRMK